MWHLDSFSDKALHIHPLTWNIKTYIKTKAFYNSLRTFVKLSSTFCDGCLSYTALEECALLLWTATPMLSNSATVRTPTATASAAITPVKEISIFLELETLKMPRIHGICVDTARMRCIGSVSLPVLDHLALNPHSAFQSSVKISCIRSVNTVSGHGFKPMHPGTGFG